MMSLEGLKFYWDENMTPDELRNRANELIFKSKKKYDAIGSVKIDDVSFENVLKALGDIEGEFYLEYNVYKFINQVSTSKDLRDASTEVETKLGEFIVETEMRQDIFKKLLVLEEKQFELPSEAERYLRKLLQRGRRNGLDLPEETQKKIKDLKRQIEEGRIQFNQNIREENTTLEFSDEELIGLPKDFINGLENCPDSGKRKVTLKYPHYCPIVRKCKRPETRQKLEFAFNSRCIKENTVILEEVIGFWQKLADLLGFPSYADYMADLRMAKTAKNVVKFLMDLAEKVKPLWEKERKCFLELKEAECKEMNIPFDGKLNAWDISYYGAKAKELIYALDADKLKEYFPLPTVTRGLLQIYQNLLGLTFEEIKNPPAWHPDVQMFKVTDTESGKLCGYFYLDLFPREGKFSHAAIFEAQHCHLLPDGTRQIVAVPVLTNFSKPTSDKPALLDQDELTTYFHEFGHAMHCMCSEVDYYHFSGIDVSYEFMEAPSQMLENWCWLPEPLKMMSGHYADQSPLPQEMMDALIKSRLANIGGFILRQICYAMFDNKLHSCGGQADIQTVYREICKEIIGLEPTEGTSMGTTFSHTIDAYPGEYYVYLWSDVFSKDMFETRFGEKNVLNPTVGKEYRNKVLKPGATKDPIDILKDFIGREPNQNAFIRSLGLQV